MSNTFAKTSDLIRLLRRRAEIEGKKNAFIFLADGEIESSLLSYTDLDAQARRIGAFLQENGAVGERVMLFYPSGIDFISAFFGCLYAGAVPVPAYPPRQTDSFARLQAIIKDCQPRFALTAANIKQRLAGRLSENSNLQNLKLIDVNEIETERESRWQHPKTGAGSAAFIQYTSGSTSTPKGVLVTHANLLHNQELIKQAFEQNADSIIAGWLPLYHDMGLIGNILQTLYLGVHCVLMSPASFLQKPFRWLNSISRYRATTSGAPNFAYDLCIKQINAEQKEQLDLSSWKTAFNGAEPIRQTTLANFAAAFADCGFKRESFRPCYGLAEATLFVSGKAGLTTPLYLSESDYQQNQVRLIAPDDKKARPVVSCGKFSADQQIIIVNPETSKVCASDEIGEIWISGKSVAEEYWNNREETAKTFRAKLDNDRTINFLRTGDLGFIRGGELFVTGRLKDLIIIRGRNHYPQDIEQTVERSHPALRHNGGAAFSIEDAGGERLIIVQELAERRTSQNLDEVFDSIRQAVAEQHELQVQNIVLLPPANLPRTSSGKVRRRTCRQFFLDDEFKAVARWQSDHRGR